MPGARVTRGERVALRTLERGDLSFVQRACTDPDLRYPLGTPVKNRTELEEGFEDRSDDRFVVCLDAPDAPPGAPDEGDTEPIGVVSVQDADWKRPELGYWLVPSVHGEGYGTEAVSLAVDYTFRTYDVPAIGAGAFASNDASRGLLESLGFTEEGCRRKFMYVDGEYRDMVQYGLLREEWRG
ncbi:GNAT family N-acetyltransferase [Halomarina litorea]|uniref:GNAT family N-acetyltransferase n=1 Tax=Halomarina litorea TaxID=2961595 RepID=UPI0020C1C256|nr:GNAT family protein [Halomarina sp. BCD28]